MERLGDQLLVDMRAVAIGGVEVIDAQRDRPAQHGMRGGAILRRAPDIRAADAHRPEAEPMDADVCKLDGFHGRLLCQTSISRGGEACSRTVADWA